MEISPMKPVVAEGESLINGCAAADCRYNHNSACRAGAVSIALLQGRPVCATYSPLPLPLAPETETRPLAL
ncbi:MAG: hypothetical protein H7Z41_01835 [Cytophagales bacterium]|nr:hypothetical protein [Armatimonadota bacterium]